MSQHAKYRQRDDTAEKPLAGGLPPQSGEGIRPHSHATRGVHDVELLSDFFLFHAKLLKYARISVNIEPLCLEAAGLHAFALIANAGVTDRASAVVVDLYRFLFLVHTRYLQYHRSGIDPLQRVDCFFLRQNLPGQSNLATETNNKCQRSDPGDAEGVNQQMDYACPEIDNTGKSGCFIADAGNVGN